ncbi:MAG: type II toxin-antitoxin system RelE/ParE family toxin [Caulobacter sp.]|nr:type II toxin-antitoxin system RelE/ParE family toxin [Caulobacter sp.]
MDQSEPPKLPMVFYRTSGGAEPVRDWLKGMSREDRLEIGADLLRAQYRWPIGMPLCRSLGGGLWEVRTTVRGGIIARVLICFHGGRLYALHGFIKKTQQTPQAALLLARRRMKDVDRD